MINNLRFCLCDSRWPCKEGDANLSRYSTAVSVLSWTSSSVFSWTVPDCWLCVCLAAADSTSSHASVSCQLTPPYHYHQSALPRCASVHRVGRLCLDVCWAWSHMFTSWSLSLDHTGNDSQKIYMLCFHSKKTSESVSSNRLLTWDHVCCDSGLNEFNSNVSTWQAASLKTTIPAPWLITKWFYCYFNVTCHNYMDYEMLFHIGVTVICSELHCSNWIKIVIWLKQQRILVDEFYQRCWIF